MENRVKAKNIFFLVVTFVLGFLSHMYLVHIQDIDIFDLLTQLEKESVVEEIEVLGEESVVCEPEIIVEEEVDPCPIQIDIGGAVLSPGVYCFEKGSSVVDAVKKAKGFTPDAGFKYISMRINLATVMLDNTKIYIPFDTDYDCTLLTFNLPKDVIDITIPDVEPQGDEEIPITCVSINTATKEELETLEGVGPSTAQKIIDGRPYTVLEDLLDVSGIGDSTFNGFKDSICL